MNSKQRRKQEKKNNFIKLGREAATHIAAAEARELQWKEKAEQHQEEVAAHSDRISELLGKSSSLTEAITIVQRELRVAEEKAAKDKESALTFAEEQHRLDIQMTISQHDADMAIQKDKVKLAEEKAARYRREWEEPDKLRRRLQAKTNENNELKAENNRLRARLAELTRGQAHFCSANHTEVVEPQDIIAEAPAA